MEDQQRLEQACSVIDEPKEASVDPAPVPSMPEGEEPESYTLDAVAADICVRAGRMGIKLRTPHGTAMENAWQLARAAQAVAKPELQAAVESVRRTCYEMFGGHIVSMWSPDNFEKLANAALHPQHDQKKAEPMDDIRDLAEKLIQLKSREYGAGMVRLSGPEESALRYRLAQAVISQEQVNPDMPDQSLRLAMGELTTDELLVARAAIRWANSVGQCRSAQASQGEEVTEAEFAEAIDQVMLCISSSRRGNSNGLRNADEVYGALRKAGIRLVRD